MLTRELLVRLPKAELHVHLDSALRPGTMVELARQAKFALPTTDPEALRRFMLVDDAGSLEDYLARFEYTIPLLQTPEAIERVAHEMVEDAARDGLRYLEVRYCPRLSTRGGLTMAQALEAELRGLARGERDFGVIDPGHQLLAPALCARGVAGDRAAVGGVPRPRRGGVRPGGRRGAAARRASTRRRSTSPRTDCLGITVHAGEAAGAESIAEAVHRCHADRIGHGTRLYEDPVLRDYIRDRRLLIETNITSNVQTRAVARAAEHPVRAYLDAGLAVTLCTDGWLMTGVSLSDEYWLAHTELGFTRPRSTG